MQVRSLYDGARAGWEIKQARGLRIGANISSSIWQKSQSQERGREAVGRSGKVNWIGPATDRRERTAGSTDANPYQCGSKFQPRELEGGPHSAEQGRHSIVVIEKCQFARVLDQTILKGKSGSDNVSHMVPGIAATISGQNGTNIKEIDERKQNGIGKARRPA